MCKIKAALAAAAIASIVSPAALAASLQPGASGGFDKAVSADSLRQEIRTVYVRRAAPVRRVIVRRVYVPYWAGAAPAYYSSYYYGGYPAYQAVPVYRTYPAARVYVAPAAPPATAVVAPVPAVTAGPAFPFLPF